MKNHSKNPNISKQKGWLTPSFSQVVCAIGLIALLGWAIIESFLWLTYHLRFILI